MPIVTLLWLVHFRVALFVLVLGRCRRTFVGQTEALLSYVPAQHAGDANRPATGTGDLWIERLDELLELFPGRSLVNTGEESCAARGLLLAGLQG